MMIDDDCTVVGRGRETRDVKGAVPGAGHALLLAGRIHEALVLGGSIPHGRPAVFR